MKAKPPRKKKPKNIRSMVTVAIRRLWLHSPQRREALKSSGYCCSKCGIKQSQAKGKEVKMQVHHDPPIKEKWKMIIDLIIKDILEAPQVPICKECHDKEHGK